jgi:hypothetical protein
MKDEKYISFLDKAAKDPKTKVKFHNLIIEDNYIPELVAEKSQRNFYQPKLIDQIFGKNRQKSFTYNTLVYIFFNINISHFCFPYIANKCGLGLTFIIFLICCLFSFMIQNSLIRFLSKNREYTESNYSSIIQNNFGEFCSGFYEFLVIIWYGTMTIICMNTGNIFLI